MVGLNDLQGFFQPKCFYDFFCNLCDSVVQENDSEPEHVALSEVLGVCSKLERLGKGRLGCQLL